MPVRTASRKPGIEAVMRNIGIVIVRNWCLGRRLFIAYLFWLVGIFGLVLLIQVVVFFCVLFVFFLFLIKPVWQ
jgi:hypothetical protein